MSELVEIGTMRVLKCANRGAVLRAAADANEMLGDAMSVDANLVAIPLERLGPDFLRLSTGIAGEVFQKFVNYRIKCAIVGDIADALARSSALADFVRETNKGDAIWFVADFDGLRARIEGSGRG